MIVLLVGVSLFVVISTGRNSVKPGYLVLNDLHIHETYTQSTEHVQWLCNQAKTLKTYANVQFLVLNGDLTDSGAPLLSLKGPGQRKEEWSILYKSLENCIKEFPIFPVPGNHDRFMVETYMHASNVFEREFTSKVLHSSHKIDRFEGSYWVEISDQKIFFFLDNSPFGINRHFWARISDKQIFWMRAKLAEIRNCLKCVTIFSHFPTGTFVPADRRKLLDMIGNFADKILSFNSGHIHRMFGSRAFAKLHFPKGEVAELSLIDFVSSGTVRWIPLDGAHYDGHPVVIDLSVKDHSLPFVGSTRFASEIEGLVIDQDEAYMTNKIVANTKTSEEFLGLTRLCFQNIYETLHYMVIGTYVVVSIVLFFFWKYNQSRNKQSTTPLINNLIVIFGLLMPVMPWAVGYGWPREDGQNEVVIAGAWGLISLTTGERREMDLMTLHVIPLLVRSAFKCLMIYTTRCNTLLGKTIHYFSMALVFLITVVGVKLLVLTYGPFLFLSPLALWELLCWGRKFYVSYLPHLKKFL